MSAHHFTVTVGAAEVAGVVHLTPGRPSPCVIAGHGMGASKDSDEYRLSEMIRRQEAVDESRRGLLSHLPRSD